MHAVSVDTRNYSIRNGVRTASHLQDQAGGAVQFGVLVAGARRLRAVE